MSLLLISINLVNAAKFLETDDLDPIAFYEGQDISDFDSDQLPDHVKCKESRNIDDYKEYQIFCFNFSYKLLYELLFYLFF